MTEYWLISVPLDKTTYASVEKLKHTLSKTKLATFYKFSIPELKVGTLDNLLGLSDDLSKLDTSIESLIKRTCQSMGEVMEKDPDKILENTLINGDCNATQEVPLSPLKTYIKALRADLVTYMTQFHWDISTYPANVPLRCLAENINKYVSQMDAELKSRTAAYSRIKTTLQGLERRTEGSLITCSLKNIVKPEDLVVSEYLTTLLVVVARGSYDQWQLTYESLSEYVVPRSSRKLYEDTENAVFSVILFKKAVNAFNTEAKKRRFIVRELDVEQEERQKQELQQLSVDKKDQYGVFMCWLKVNFSEMCANWIHLKALRVFVESVIRYGLPVSYQALLLKPDRKQVKKLRGVLASLFMHLDPTAPFRKSDVSYDIPGLCQQEYLSYICFLINTNLLESSLH